jgi:hypothetical protein
MFLNTFLIFAVMAAVAPSDAESALVRPAESDHPYKSALLKT